MIQCATDSNRPQRTKVIGVPEWWGREKEADSRHQLLSDGTVRRRLQRGMLQVLDHNQTGADFISAKNIDNRFNEREQRSKGKEP
jgi:hypothetical protein